MIFTTAHISRKGGRNYNEDFCGFSRAENSYCWVMADGLGGHGGGDYASQLVVNTVLQQFEKNPGSSVADLEQYLAIAQGALLAHQQRVPKLSLMRTTIVVVVSDGDKIIYAHIGDSRLYLLRDGWTERALTKDHSVTQVMADTGDITYQDMRSHIDRNKLLRAMGNPKDFRPDIVKESLLLGEGDALLICTDGFWDYIEELGICADYAKARNPEQWLTIMEMRLLAMLRERQITDNDNYSAMTIFVR